MTEIVPLSAEKAALLLAFFDREDQGFCYCRFWDFAGPNEEWLKSEPGANRAACVEAIANGKLSGMLALEDGRVVGWLRHAWTRELPKLAKHEPAAIPERCASILCFAIASEARGRGVARALLDGALARLFEEGATEVHAYPRPQRQLEPGRAWTGPLPLYEGRGFHGTEEREGRLTLRKGKEASDPRGS